MFNRVHRQWINIHLILSKKIHNNLPVALFHACLPWLLMKYTSFPVNCVDFEKCVNESISISNPDTLLTKWKVTTKSDMMRCIKHKTPMGWIFHWKCTLMFESLERSQRHYETMSMSKLDAEVLEAYLYCVIIVWSKFGQYSIVVYFLLTRSSPFKLVLFIFFDRFESSIFGEKNYHWLSFNIFSFNGICAILLCPFLSFRLNLFEKLVGVLKSNLYFHFGSNLHRQ